MEKGNDFIYTDDKIMIKLDWIKNIRKVNDCYKFKINNDKYFEFEICRGNPSFNRVEQKFGFIKK
jgi:hypothetical protein